MLIISKCYALKHLCSATLTTLDIFHISVSNISLFLLRVTFCLCHLLSYLFFSQTTTAPVSPWFNLDWLYQSIKLASFCLAISMAILHSSTKTFQEKTCNSMAEIGSVLSAGSILNSTKTCQAK